jgi:integrase/recombinase XerD
MMKRDLAASRQTWIEEATSESEKAKREESDRLMYQDESGLFADFHSNRHTFISNLGRAGVPLIIAQKLARHSDPRLTANRYTHLEMEDKAAAIASLPTPVSTAHPRPVVAVGMPLQPVAPNVGPALAVVRAVGTSAVVLPAVSAAVTDSAVSAQLAPKRKSGNDKTFGNRSRQTSPDVTVHPGGLEPPTFGSVDRCSIQLS